MRLLRTLLCLSLTILSSHAADETDFAAAPKVKHDYQSDVARLRKIVINRQSPIVSDREIFIRELISNANDALEKLRLTALTDKEAWNGEPLNITIKAVKNEDGKGGRIIISDTGIGMSPEELTTNLGTLAKSGTSDFLAKAEGQDTTGNGNLIGAFGLGFYSSFLVADRVTVASIPPKSTKVPEPAQHVFSSSADDASFEIFPDPRGNTLGRGTEITLFLKEDATEYLETDKITELITKHSSFSSSFPVYLFTQKTEEVPDEDVAEEPDTTTDADAEETPAVSDNVDEDEAIVEEVTAPPKTKSIVVDEWVQLNAMPPIWTRDPKTVSDEEYGLFYNAFFKDFNKPLGWHHFSGDSGSGVSFKAILYLPGKIDEEYWQQPLASKSKDIKLMVKRTFITSDLGEHGLPKWASWVKVVIDADDLPLNVSRETLQSNKFFKQLKGIIIKRLIQLFLKIAEEDPVKFRELEGTYGSIFKLGAVEDVKNRDKLASITRFSTTQRNETSLDQYLENRKQGQKQIFYLAEMGKKPEDLAQSVFVEKLHARGYEVLLLTEPLDEILFGNLRKWKNVPFQDVAKAGLKFGDEDQDPEEEKEEQKRLTEKFKPVLDWLKVEAKDIVRDVVISNRLVKSPCAIVAETGGYTANVQKMMAASNAKGNKGGILHEFAMKAKSLEINPRSPLIEGLLRRIENLPSEEDERDLEAEEELREVALILIDGALVRSGFEVPDSNRFFSRVDKVLRRSLGVSETAPTDETVRPAPPVDPELPSEEEEQPPAFPPLDEEDDGKAKVIVPEHMKNDVSIEMEEIDDDDNVVQHDEL
ncbi:heat shock protein Hsp90 [Lyophyllum atratum]|nr:heat shock protein Hsp90 [Lyophyllum atratum]